MLTQKRKEELGRYADIIFNAISPDVKGNQSLAEFTMKRVFEVAKDKQEAQFMVDYLTAAIKKDPKELAVFLDGKEIRAKK